MSSGDLVADDFVRRAFRLTTPIKGSLIKTAQVKIDSIRDVWRDMGQVFCHFELDRHGSLLCVFGSRTGVLLGETVRDWLVENEPGRDNIIWCERLGKEYALVYIVAGQVVQESFENSGGVAPGMQQLIDRAAAYEKEGFRIFVHDSAKLVRQALDEDGEHEVQTLAMSVLDHIKQEAGSPPMLAPYRRAVRHMMDPLRILRMALLGILAAAVLVPGTWLVTDWMLEAVPEPDFSSIETNSAMAKAYRDSLQAPGADALLQAIHRAGLQFQADKWFGENWRVTSLQWNRGSGHLTVKAHLPNRPGALQRGEYEPLELPAPLRARVEAEAQARGWQVNLENLGASFEIPLDGIVERDESEVRNIHRFMPDEDGFQWSLAQLATAFKPWGKLETRPLEDERNDIYETRKASLHLPAIPWVKSNAVSLLSRNLAGGPVILEAVEFETLPNGSGGFMQGTILFHTIWRSP